MLLPVLLLLVSALAFWQQLKLQKMTTDQQLLHDEINDLRTQVAAAEISNLTAQINDHFIANGLTIIQLEMARGNIEGAKIYAAQFSKLLRSVIAHSRERDVRLSADLQVLQTYVEMEQRRLPNSFDFKIEMSAEINATHTFIPPFLMQPYVENAINHGLLGRVKSSETTPQYLGQITVRFFKKENQIVIEIEDNGIGRAAAEQQSAKRKSYGMLISAERLEKLHQYFLAKTDVNIVDLAEPTGTKVILTVPYNMC